MAIKHKAKLVAVKRSKIRSGQNNIEDEKRTEEEIFSVDDIKSEEEAGIENLFEREVEEPAGSKMNKPDEAANTGSGKKRRPVRVIAAVLMSFFIAAFLVMIGAALFIKYSSSPVGYWKITEAKANDIVMTKEDAEAVGLKGIGYLRLNRSGSCSLRLLDDKYKGTWKQTKKGTIKVSYGEGDTLNATIDKRGVMTATDKVKVEYKLKK